MNHVILIGYVGADPEVRQTKTGKTVCSFRIATRGHGKDKEESTTWHRVTVWERQAELCAAYVHKGSKVAVAGRLQTRKYEDREGRTRHVTEIVAHLVNFLDRRMTAGEDSSTSPKTRLSIPRSEFGAADDEIPF
jgi:single-strand DNA-binding protein